MKNQMKAIDLRARSWATSTWFLVPQRWCDFGFHAANHRLRAPVL